MGQLLSLHISGIKSNYREWKCCYQNVCITCVMMSELSITKPYDQKKNTRHYFFTSSYSLLFVLIYIYVYNIVSYVYITYIGYILKIVCLPFWYVSDEYYMIWSGNILII